MRRCCCCVSVHWGAALLGLLSVVLVGLELAVLVPYLIRDDNFNPIEKNVNSVVYVMESLLEESGADESTRLEAKRLLQTWLWTALLVETCLAVLYALWQAGAFRVS